MDKDEKVAAVGEAELVDVVSFIVEWYRGENAKVLLRQVVYHNLLLV